MGTVAWRQPGQMDGSTKPGQGARRLPGESRGFAQGHDMAQSQQRHHHRDDGKENRKQHPRVLTMGYMSGRSFSRSKSVRGFSGDDLGPVLLLFAVELAMECQQALRLCLCLRPTVLSRVSRLGVVDIPARLAGQPAN